MRLLSVKIKSLPELKKIILRLKTQGKTTVLTNGCFDLLHYGHVKYLEEARRLGDCLVVAINSDGSIKRLKEKNRPIIEQRDRLRIIAGLESVDYVLLFNEQTPFKVIKYLKPDILVKGRDWNKSNIVGSAYVSSYGGKVLTMRLLKGRSTTNLIRKIAKGI